MEENDVDVHYTLRFDERQMNENTIKIKVNRSKSKLGRYYSPDLYSVNVFFTVQLYFLVT